MDQRLHLSSSPEYLGTLRVEFLKENPGLFGIWNPTYPCYGIFNQKESEFRGVKTIWGVGGCLIHSLKEADWLESGVCIG